MRGRITVDGHPKEQATFARISGYVEQVKGVRSSFRVHMTDCTQGMLLCRGYLGARSAFCHQAHGLQTVLTV